MIYTLITISLLALCAFFFSNTNKTSKKKTYIINQENLYKLISNHEIKERQKFISRDYSNALILDMENNLHIFNNKFKDQDGLFTFEYAKYPSNQILESEVIIDNQSLIKSVRSSQIKGAVIGGLVLGGVGAIIGGLSGSKIKHDSVKNVDLKITVEDLNKPVYRINFLKNVDPYSNEIIKEGYSKESSEIKASLTNIEKWHGIVDVLIKKQNKESIS